MWRWTWVVVVAACGDDDRRGGEAETSADADVAVETVAETTAETVAETSVDAVAEAETVTETTAETVAETVEDTAAEAETENPGWRWEAGPTLPAKVQENAVLAVGDALWVLGGFQNLTLVDKVRVLAAGAAEWTDGPALPRTLHHMNAAVVGGRVYVVGSLSGFEFAAIADAWRVDPAAETPAWEPLTAMPNARRRGAAGVAVVGASIYVAGGFRGGAVAEVDAFDTSKPDAPDAWTIVASLPGARDHGAAVSLDGKVWYVGGRDSDITAVHGDLWSFDPAAPEAGWVAHKPLPTPRGGIAAAVYEGLIIVLGGEGNTDVASGVFPEVEAYDPGTDTWTSLPPMLTPRHGTAAVAFDGALWMPGGADVQAFGASAVVERLVRAP